MRRILHVHFKPKHNVGDAAVVLAVRQLVEARLGKIRWTSMVMKSLRLEASPRLVRHINAHDLVIIGGGGFCSKFALPLNDDLIAAVRKPIVLFGVGHNRHYGDSGLDAGQRQSLQLLGQKAALCGVRDRLTLDMLEELGIRATLTGDPALYLQPRKPWRVPPRRPPAIGFNIACHGWGGQAELFQPTLDMFRRVIRRLVAGHDPGLFYMVHTDVEKPVAKRLAREFPGLRICRQPAPKLRYMYGQLDLVISMMLHSSILAFAAGTPVINIAYDDKNRAFLEDVGQAQRCFSVQDVTADAVIAACEPVLTAAPSRGNDGVRATYGDEMDKFAGQIAALCGRPGIEA